MAQIQAPRGTQDVLPEEQSYFKLVEDVVAKYAAAFGFGRIETPLFEEQDLFIRSLGKQTEVVQKEMFAVERKGRSGDEGKQYVLRPENTAPIVRAYIEQGMSSWPQPVKLWYFGPQFRAERPQKGRLRQFTQFGYEVLGDSDPATDALVILLTQNVFETLGLDKDIVIEINTLGSIDSRKEVVAKIKAYYEPLRGKLCKDDQRRLDTNPLRLLDCKEEKCQQFKKDAPKLPEIVDEDDQKQFKLLQKYLDTLGVQYELNPLLVRGFDYYTRTTFEVRDRVDTTRQSSLGGGGRYDGLVELYGGPKTPAIGFAGGVERIIEKLKEKNIKIPKQPKPKVMVMPVGESAKLEALKIFAQLSQAGIAATINPKDSLKAQLRMADKLGVTYAVIIGDQELKTKQATVRTMADGSQKTVAFDKLTQHLK